MASPAPTQCRNENRARPRPAKPSLKSGGAERDRTADLYNAIVALSQLSYSPVPIGRCATGNVRRILGPAAVAKVRERKVFPAPHQAVLIPLWISRKSTRR